MAEKDARTEKSTGSAAPNWFAAGITEMGREQTNAMMKMQTEIFDAVQGWHNHCLARMQSEATLASDTASKLLAARSIPDATSVYREWLNQRLVMLGKDNERLLADGQKIIQASQKAFANGRANGT